jgi:hypothetical protein
MRLLRYRKAHPLGCGASLQRLWPPSIRMIRKDNEELRLRRPQSDARDAKLNYAQDSERALKKANDQN